MFAGAQHARDTHARSDTNSRYRSPSSIFGCDLWLLFSRGHSHLGDDGHIDLINSFISCQSHSQSHSHDWGMCTFTRAITAKTHRFTAGITQLSASSIPHLLHVCFSVSLLFLFSSPQATSPSPLLSTRFNPFLFCPRSRSFYRRSLPVTWFFTDSLLPIHTHTHTSWPLFDSLLSSTWLHTKVISWFINNSQHSFDRNLAAGDGV